MSAPDEAPWRDPGRPREERARALLAAMRLEEKVAQLGAVWPGALAEDGAFAPERARRLLADGMGQVTRIGAATGLRPAERAAFANRIQRFLVEETRLGIPAIVHEEATAGLCARDADQFPQALGLAATFDPEGVERMARAIRVQARATGAHLVLAPVLDVARDPRWGRVEETYGEDPYLIGRMGVAYVRGLQGDDLREGVAATAKHFLGYGLPEGGHNHKPAHLGPRELRDVVARPFLEAIHEAGLAAVMNAYNDVDGLPCGGSPEILDALLRGELGFRGLVVADYFTTQLLVSAHRVAADKGEAGQRALEAGLDVELPTVDAFAELPARVRDGRLAEAAVDRAVLRVLELKLALGLFEAPLVDEGAAAARYGRPEERVLARELAAKSVVLLEDAAGLLPLPREGRLAVIGPLADDPRLLQGDYHYPAHAEIVYRRSADDLGAVLPRPDEASFAPGPFLPPSTTPLAALREAVGDAGAVPFARGCDVTGDDDDGIPEAVAAARDADRAVLLLGGRSGLTADCTVGEFRDAADLGLPGVQARLAEEVLATGTPTVVVVMSGRVHALSALAGRAGALLLAFPPGQEGGAGLADVLFGAVAPSGRLPVTLPRHVGQVPIHAGRSWEAEGGLGPFTPDYVDLPAAPLFPFGHGLSTTRFRYADLAVEPASVAPDGEVEVAVTVANEGPRAGDEVVQLYVRDPVARVVRPRRQLAGFARVRLAPGEARRVRFRLDPARLGFHDARLAFVVEPGEVQVAVGASSEDLRLRGAFRIEGPERSLHPSAVRPTGVRVEPASGAAAGPRQERPGTQRGGARRPRLV